MNYFLFTAIILAQTTEPVGVPAFVPIVIAVILLLLFWWGLSRNSIPQGAAEHTLDDLHDSHEEYHDAAMGMAATESIPSEAAEMAAVRTTAVNLYDRKIIEGIGPKIEGILHDAGIHTFTDLAAASVSELERIVRHDAGIRVAFPDTWPQQAQLAADGKWTELEQLQDELKGGRHA